MSDANASAGLPNMADVLTNKHSARKPSITPSTPVPPSDIVLRSSDEDDVFVDSPHSHSSDDLNRLLDTSNRSHGPSPTADMNKENRPVESSASSTPTTHSSGHQTHGHEEQDEFARPSTSFTQPLHAWHLYTSYLNPQPYSPPADPFQSDDYAINSMANYSAQYEMQMEKFTLGIDTRLAVLSPVDQTRLTFARVCRHNKRSTAPQATTNDFYFAKTLGEGSFASVYHVFDKSGKDYAMKIMDAQEIRRQRKLPYVVREKHILATLEHGFGGHPFVCKLISSFQEENRMCFLLEYAPGGELLEVLRKLGSFDLTTSRFFAAEILEGLGFIHSCGIVHRDLKPENVLLKKDGHIMLADFGSAKVIGFEGDDPQEVSHMVRHKDGQPEKKARSSFVGTTFYISPEVAKCEACTPAADFWAFGCMVYQMISGQPPFRGINDFQVMKKINQLDYKFPQGFDLCAQGFVSQLLVLDPGSRLDAAKCRAHPFFEGINFAHLTQLTPPTLKPFLPASGDEPAFYSDFVPTKDMEPGLGKRTMARLMGLAKEFGEFGMTEPRQIKLSAEEVAAKQRMALLEVQRREHPYHRFVEDNLILRFGIIDKKKGMFARRRMFLLTEGPRLFYVDIEAKELRGEIPITPSVRCEAKNFRTFFVHTPMRTYFLFDPESRANEWCQDIEAAKVKYCKPDQPDIDFYPRGKLFTNKSKRVKLEQLQKERDAKRKDKHNSPPGTKKSK